MRKKYLSVEYIQVEGVLYTQKHLEAIEKAICDLQNGKRVTSVSYGDTHVQYANLSLDDLLKLRSQIKSGIEDSALNNRKRQVIFSTSKGV